VLALLNSLPLTVAKSHRVLPRSIDSLAPPASSLVTIMAYEQAQRQYTDNTHYTDPGSQINGDLLGNQGHRHPSPSNVRPGTMPEHNRYGPPQKVDEAVTSAFSQASTESASQIPPEVIEQITQSVIKQLQSGGLDGSTPVPPPQSRFSPPPQQPVPLSPSTASGTSQNMPNRVFTPPSPFKHSDYPDHASPSHSQSGHLPAGPRSPVEHKSSHFSPPRRSPSPQSYASDSSDKPYTRPKGPSRLSTSTEETTLEKIWGQLFDEDSHPTVRLGQFLRGLAIHIVRYYFCHSGYDEGGPLLIIGRRLRTTNPNTVLSLRPTRW